jgi:hypothetical protein
MLLPVTYMVVFYLIWLYQKPHYIKLLKHIKITKTNYFSYCRYRPDSWLCNFLLYSVLGNINRLPTKTPNKFLFLCRIDGLSLLVFTLSSNFYIISICTRFSGQKNLEYLNEQWQMLILSVISDSLLNIKEHQKAKSAALYLVFYQQSHLISLVNDEIFYTRNGVCCSLHMDEP